MLSLFRVFALFPLGLLQVMGWLLGWLAFLASPSYRRRFLANAALAGVGLLGALGNAGATPGVLGILGVTGALLVVGLMYLFGAALWGVRPMGALGCWLLVLAAGVGFAGPVTATLAGSVLGGGAFLATAAWLRAVRSRCPR